MSGSVDSTLGQGRATPELSLVVLAYRSEDFARSFAQRAIAALETAGVESFELVLVANWVEGSADSTPEVARRLAETDPRIRCVAEPKRGWMGWDMKRGLAAARGRYLAVIDGDGQMPVRDVAELFHLIRIEGHDLVKTFRITRGDGPWRWTISAVYNLLVRVLFPGLLVRDVNSKPKVLTRDAYSRLDLRDDDWFIDAEIMLEAHRLGMSVAELPTGFRGLVGRRSFVRARAILEMLASLLAYRWRTLVGARRETSAAR